MLSKSQPHRKALFAFLAFLISSSALLQAVAATTTWTKVATEGATFSVSGTQTVRYGADTRWVQKVVSGSGQCTNAFFASDPAFGVVKSCEVLGGATPTTTWTKIAAEGATFSVSGTQTVRYGAGTRWVQKVVTGSGQCTNAFFASDPAFGVVKSCEVLGGVTPTTTWTKIAAEGATFSVSGTQTVRYGADTRWVQKVVTGSGQCTNAFFASDPAVGVVKSCQLLTNGTPPPTATTGTAALSWTAPPGTVTGYRVYYGVASHSYVQARGTGLLVKTPSVTVSGLPTGHTYYFAVTAIAATGVESAYSNEASKLIP